MSAPLILATGFLPFPSAPLNPTAWLMRRLGEEGWTPEGARLALHTLPTTYDVCEAALMPLIADLKPAAVVQFGLSARATGVTLERTALNMQTTARPDAAGGFAATPWIDPLGPATNRGTNTLRFHGRHTSVPDWPATPWQSLAYTTT